MRPHYQPHRFFAMVNNAGVGPEDILFQSAIDNRQSEMLFSVGADFGGCG
jgi:hypothetical protein